MAVLHTVVRIVRLLRSWFSADGFLLNKSVNEYLDCINLYLPNKILFMALFITDMAEMCIQCYSATLSVGCTKTVFLKVSLMHQAPIPSINNKVLFCSWGKNVGRVEGYSSFFVIHVPVL